MAEDSAPAAAVPEHGKKLKFKKPDWRTGSALLTPALALSAAQQSIDGRTAAQSKLLTIRPGAAVRESPLTSPTQLTPSLNPSVTHFRRFFQELDILIEYKLVCHHLSGESIYVAPSLKTGRVWHGIVCLHNGPFRGGCFRFNIFLNDSFPEDRPTLRFCTRVFHPQVNQNGCMNLMQAFPEWRPRKDHIWHVLKFMKQMFCSFDTWQPLNEKATIAVHESMEAFQAQAATCVLDSIQHLQEEAQSPDDDDGNVLKFFNLTQEDVLEGKEIMLSGELPDFSDDQPNSFLDRVTQRVSEMWESLSSIPPGTKPAPVRTTRSPRASIMAKMKRKGHVRRSSSQSSTS